MGEKSRAFHNFSGRGQKKVGVYFSKAGFKSMPVMMKVRAGSNYK